MTGDLTRRNLLQFASLMLPARALGLTAGNFPPERLFKPAAAHAFERAPEPSNNMDDAMPVSDLFPSHPPELVREMVTVAHFNLKRVKEIADARPSLARAAWDWGFGDWESALGAASHMGNRPIAEYLISQGARPSLFSAAMLGQLDVVKAFIAAQPGAQHIQGPHSISLLAHARMGGQTAHPVLDFLQSLGDADMDAPVSLPDGEAAALTGTYVFGVGISQQVEVTADMKLYVANKMYTHAPQLNWTRKGTMTRPLFHLGDHTFYPAGAPSTRIRFTQDAGGALMNVTDAGLTLTARRNQ
ncbi:MAG: hypothetical protein WAM91_05780 [Candidatus Acidiferrales bacterium]